MKDVVDPWGASTTAAATVDDAFGASPFTTDAFADAAATTSTTSGAAATFGDAAKPPASDDFFADGFKDDFSSA